MQLRARVKYDMYIQVRKVAVWNVVYWSLSFCEGEMISLCHVKPRFFFIDITNVKIVNLCLYKPTCPKLIFW